MTPSLSAELIALVDASGGFAVVVDPVTQRKIELRDPKRISLPTEPESAEELRAMLDAARKDFDEGNVVQRTTDEFLAQCRRRAGLE
jgi:hypothetical protein